MHRKSETEKKGDDSRKKRYFCKRQIYATCVALQHSLEKYTKYSELGFYIH